MPCLCCISTLPHDVLCIARQVVAHVVALQDLLAAQPLLHAQGQQQKGQPQATALHHD